MPRILAIDPGSNFLGWAIVDNFINISYKVIKYDFIKPKKGTSDPECQIGGEGFNNIRTHLLLIISKYNPDILVLEKYTIGRKSKGMYVVPKVQAIVEQLWWELSKKEIESISSFTWKTHLVKNAVATKIEVKKKLIALRLVNSDTNQDACDAIGQAIGFIYNTASPLKNINTYNIRRIKKTKRKKRYKVRKKVLK